MPFPIDLQKIMARTQILVKKFRFLHQWPYIGHPHNISAVGDDLETVTPFKTPYLALCSQWQGPGGCNQAPAH